MTQFSAGRFLRARKAAEGALAREQALQGAGDAPPHARQPAHAGPHDRRPKARTPCKTRPRATRTWTRRWTPPPRPAPPPELREGVLLRAARWSLQRPRPAGALARLDELPTGANRRTAALRVKLKAARQAGRIAEAMDTARLLAKHRAFSPEAARSLVRSLAAELIGRAHDAGQLQAVWDSLDAADRTMPELALRAAQRLQTLGGDAHLARGWLLPVWEGRCAAPQCLARPGAAGRAAWRCRRGSRRLEARGAGLKKKGPLAWPLVRGGMTAWHGCFRKRSVRRAASSRAGRDGFPPAPAGLLRPPPPGGVRVAHAPAWARRRWRLARPRCAQRLN
jgi:hypothetical protein